MVLRTPASGGTVTYTAERFINTPPHLKWGPLTLKCHTGFGNIQNNGYNMDIRNAILGDKKYILKSLAYDYIPQELLSGPKKGFGVPLRKWLRGPLKDEIRRFSDENFLRQQGIFNVIGVKQLIQKQEASNNILYSSMLWSYYMFQRWFDEYVGI